MILANRSARIAAGTADYRAEALATGWDPHADRYDPAEWVADTDPRPTWWCDGCHRWTTAPADHTHHVTPVADAFRAAQRADALDIITAIDPTADEVAEWDDHDWYEIADTLDIPTPAGTRSAVAALLAEQGR